MQTRKMRIKAMLERVCQAYEVEKDQLPQIFGCQAKTINNWVYYQRIPYEQLEQCRIETGKSMDWLLFGSQDGVRLSPPQKTELTQLIYRRIADGLDYKAIKECYPGGADTVADKLVKETLEFFDHFDKRTFGKRRGVS